MKLCLITYDMNLVGGIEQVISTLSSQFAGSFGWNIDILSLNSTKQDTFFLLSEKVRILHGKAKNIEEGKQVMRTYLLGGEKKYDVILTFHLFIGDEMARIAGKLPTGTKWVATEHNSVSYYTWKRKLINYLVYRRADALVVLSEVSASFYRKKGFRHVTVIPNAVSFETEEVSPLDQKQMLAVGRMEPVKGYEKLIQSFLLAAEQEKAWKLRMVGDGSLKEKLEQQAGGLKAKDRIEFPGYRKNIRDELMKSSLLVISSEHECFPVIALEAMECGVPILSFAIPEICEMDGNSGAMAFVEQGNVEKMAEKMVELMQNPHLLQEMGCAAKARAAAYHRDGIGERWKTFLTELCSR